MWRNEVFDEITTLILSGRLSKSIEMLENYLFTHPRQYDMGLLAGLKDDYRLMAEYWYKGFDDPQREQVYGQLLRRMYRLATNVAIHERMRNTPLLMGAYTRARSTRGEWSLQGLRNDLESYVTDVAMLELEPEHTRLQKAHALHSAHQQMMSELFGYIWTSPLWKDAQAEAFEDILLSPTIDTRDQQLIVSAVMLSAMNAFCFNKFKVLVAVYRRAADEQLRQRALVGWVLSADADKARLYKEMHDMVAGLCRDERVRQELTELQMQMLLCMNAEDDTLKIQNEIMPELMKGNNLRITRQGIQEMDEDTLENILHPDAAEQNMERMEQNVRRMIDMQKSGSDIYFGGFSQMKRFSFFNDISNWFVPFNPDHPGISQTWSRSKGRKFLHTILKLGAFCDSDKYSFVLAFDQVLDRMPQQMLDMIERGEASGMMPIGGEVTTDEQQQPAFIRRLYLQNLYRFFRLHHQRGEFVNPFCVENCLFFADTLFHGTELEKQMIEVGAFLYKRKRFTEAMAVLDNVSESRHTFDYNMLMGHLLMHRSKRRHDVEMLSAADFYRKALAQNPENERALRGYARACFAEQHYQLALDAYNQLLNMEGEENQQKSILLNAAICLVNLKRYEEALKPLYKLNYLYQDDKDVMRVLAWAITLNGKYEQAIKLYGQLVANEKPQADDLLNYGYCLWFSGDAAGAAGTMKMFCSLQADEQFTMEHELLVAEYDLLHDHGISDTEIQLMLDFLRA